MKRRIYSAVALIAIAAGVATFLWLRSRAPDLRASEPSSGSNNDGKAEIHFRDVADAVANPSSLLPEGIKSAARERKAQQDLTRAVEGMNKPISFYGRVVDQNDVPLSGAKVYSSVRHWDPSAPNLGGFIPLTIESDSAGRFYFGGVTGDAVGINSINKPGYEPEPTPQTYGAVGGSSDNPITFRMWSTNIHEQLITGKKPFHIMPDGRAYVIDLHKGTIAESGEGDIRVWVKRPEQVTRGQRYDWSCGIEGMNGSDLQEFSPDSSPYLAPTGGYQPSFQYDQIVREGWADTTGAKSFHISFNGGKEYGWLLIELVAFYDKRTPGMIRVEYAINPSGSRVLR